MKKKIIINLTWMILIFTCSAKNSTSPNNNAPADHTVSNNGVMHKSGLNEPLKNCVSCHGADLKGSNTAPSCYSCHAKKW